jgi:hypothetical protein
VGVRGGGGGPATHTGGAGRRGQGRHGARTCQRPQPCADGCVRAFALRVQTAGVVARQGAAVGGLPGRPGTARPAPHLPVAFAGPTGLFVGSIGSRVRRAIASSLLYCRAGLWASTRTAGTDSDPISKANTGTSGHRTSLASVLPVALFASSTTFQAWNNIFLSQQISISISTSRKISQPNRAVISFLDESNIFNFFSKYI